MPAETPASSDYGSQIEESSVPNNGQDLWRQLVLWCVGLLVIAGAGVLYQTISPSGEARQEARVVFVEGQTLDFGGAFAAGAPEAPITVVEFSDFECPYCRRFAQTTQPPITTRFVRTGRVKWVFRNLAIAEIHPSATLAAATAVCAGEQGEFWRMHDHLFGVGRQTKLAEALSTDALRSVTAALGLSTSQFERCLQKGDADERIRIDRSEADRLGIDSTPTFLLGQTTGTTSLRVVKVIKGMLDEGAFAAAIEAVASVPAPNR
jgi:protein-disulfide isomerase